MRRSTSSAASARQRGFVRLTPAVRSLVEFKWLNLLEPRRCARLAGRHLLPQRHDLFRSAPCSSGSSPRSSGSSRRAAICSFRTRRASAASSTSCAGSRRRSISGGGDEPAGDQPVPVVGRCRRGAADHRRHRRDGRRRPARRRDRDLRARQLRRGLPVRPGVARRGDAALPAARVEHQCRARDRAAGGLRRHRHSAAASRPPPGAG